MRSLGKAGAFDILRLTDKRQPGKGVIDSKRCTWTLSTLERRQRIEGKRRRSKRQHRRGSSNRLTYAIPLLSARRKEKRREEGRGWVIKRGSWPCELEGGRKGKPEVAGYGGRKQRGRDPRGYYLGKLCQSYLRLKAETRMRGRDMK